MEPRYVWKGIGTDTAIEKWKIIVGWQGLRYRVKILSKTRAEYC